MKFRLLIAGALLLVACGGGQKVKDKPVHGEPADLDAPSVEELAQSPCGNPDWSELPAGSDAPMTDSEEAPQQ